MARDPKEPRPGGIVVSGRTLAIVELAVSLVRVLIDRAFSRRRGLERFLSNYQADRLPPVTVDERALAPALSRCVACGICDEGEGARIAASRGAYPGLMQVVLASSRSMPDYDAARVALEHVPDAVLAEKEAICPTRVPFVEMARFVRSKTKEMRDLARSSAGDLGPLSERADPALPTST